MRGRSESLARQFDRVLGLLQAWGYVDGWTLTPAGEILARLYTETDLLLAESLREGLFDGLTPPEVAALVVVLHVRAPRRRQRSRPRRRHDGRRRRRRTRA